MSDVVHAAAAVPDGSGEGSAGSGASDSDDGVALGVGAAELVDTDGRGVAFGDAAVTPLQGCQITRTTATTTASSMSSTTSRRRRYTARDGRRRGFGVVTVPG